MNIVIFGAHQDDIELTAGGTAALWAEAGHRLLFGYLTNGNTGHQSMGGGQLARRREEEAKRAAAMVGAEVWTLDVANNDLLPTLENRKAVVNILRQFQADAVCVHRPYDYHPDHRYSGQVVNDAIHTVTIPNFAPLTAHLRTKPVLLYLQDGFQRPYPFQADVVVPVDSVMEKKFRMVAAHESQVYEWLPYAKGQTGVPEGGQERFEWLKQQYGERFERTTEQRFRQRLGELYGAEADRIRYAEGFEISEYGFRPDETKLRELFPFGAW